MGDNMINSSSPAVILDEEIDRLMILCTHISQMASRIRLDQLSNICFSTDYIKSYHNLLLSMAENVEGSAVLLESLVAVEQRKSRVIEKKKTRIHYTREELFKLRQRVTPDLSIQMKKVLDRVVERESNHPVRTEIKSWRNIRTILA